MAQRTQGLSVLTIFQYKKKVELLREGFNEKKTFSFGHRIESPPPPPLTQIRATWSFFSGRQNSRFESQFITKNTVYTI